jgi:hypothetical protein
MQEHQTFFRLAVVPIIKTQCQNRKRKFSDQNAIEKYSQENILLIKKIVQNV